MLRQTFRLRAQACRKTITRSTRYPSLWTRYRSSNTPKAQPSASRRGIQRLRLSYALLIRRIAVWGSAVFLGHHIIGTYFFNYGPCDGISMLPTFNSFGDNVLISRYYRRGRGVKVGDVVSYAHPIHSDVTGLKRVLGLEGDFVLRDTPQNDLEGVALGKGEGPEKMIQIPQGHCWIVGDNMEWSHDSRLFGPLPMALIRGKAIARFAPWWKLWAPVRMYGLREPDGDDEVD